MKATRPRTKTPNFEKTSPVSRSRGIASSWQARLCKIIFQNSGQSLTSFNQRYLVHLNASSEISQTRLRRDCWRARRRRISRILRNWVNNSVNNTKVISSEEPKITFLLFYRQRLPNAHSKWPSYLSRLILLFGCHYRISRSKSTNSCSKTKIWKRCWLIAPSKMPFSFSAISKSCVCIHIFWMTRLFKENETSASSQKKKKSSSKSKNASKRSEILRRLP